MNVNKTFEDIDCYKRWSSDDALAESRRDYEGALLRAWELMGSDKYAFVGYCVACSRESVFVLDRLYSAPATDGKDWVPNWRERIYCSSCLLNNRTRASIVLLEGFGLDSQSLIWLAEQTTPLYAYLSRRYPGLLGSEYLGANAKSGSMGEGLLRHEDATSTSFGDASLDAVLSFDVLEHIPDYDMAFSEAARILKPGGFMLWSAPFSISGDSTIIRAYIDDSGELFHLLPEQYHGDPLKPAEGVLCYQVFGWDVLDLMESAGFLGAEVRVYWNRENANVGPEQIFIVGRR